jgi:NADH:ubiquinone oxidoreductase subunit F (NADH-binding)/ferredoxin
MSPSPAPDAPDAPDVLRLGPARLTAGLDRMPRLDAMAHHHTHGPMPLYGPDALLSLLDRIALRGRGGAGFPFARKARAVLDAARRSDGARSAPIAVVVNATEGEPASAKDAMLLTRAPHLVLDGAALAAATFGGGEIVLGTSAGGAGEASLTAAVAEHPLPVRTRVVGLPQRFVSGESGALLRGLSGRPAIPPPQKARASDGGPAGLHGLPTLLSNAETFAQLALAARLGPDAYAVVGAPEEPGTLLLTVARPDHPRRLPVVVEVPTGTRLGVVLGACGLHPGQGVLVGGYHGAWLAPRIAADAPLARDALAALGGALGAGAVIALPPETCPLGEVARVAAWLAGESSGQCGPCRLGLPDLAGALAALVAGDGGSALDHARSTAAAVRGRGACAHPDGTAGFVLSALGVFADDLTAHQRGAGCGRRVLGVLPLPGDRAGGYGDGTGPRDSEGAARPVVLRVDWSRCDGHGLCAGLAPDLVSLGPHGYPVLSDRAVPPWLLGRARRAVSQCPALALRLTGGRA